MGSTFSISSFSKKLTRFIFLLTLTDVFDFHNLQCHCAVISLQIYISACYYQSFLKPLSKEACHCAPTFLQSIADVFKKPHPPQEPAQSRFELSITSNYIRFVLSKFPRGKCLIFFRFFTLSAQVLKLASACM
jgi:hypothetical protein